MVDWTQPMRQTFEHYAVDPGTWRDARRLTNVTGCTIQRDPTLETLGKATIDVADELLDECYVRSYLVAEQGRSRERVPLGTHIVQTPSSSFDGAVTTATMDAYTPLLELKEKRPPLGYSILKGANVMDEAYLICRSAMRAPVVRAPDEKALFRDFVANVNDTWATFVRDLVANARMELDMDETGRLIFSPVQELAALQPVWTYTDDNSSILYPSISRTRDLYGLPNVVEVVYSNGTDYFEARVVNDDSASPTSTVNRGREISYRDTSPSLSGTPTKGMVEDYALDLLEKLSAVEYELSYSHGYCPVRVGDCVRLDYRRAGLSGVKAEVTYQSISCSGSCKVTEKAVYSSKYWRRP